MRSVAAVAAGVGLILGVAALVACGSAEAKPIEVTYYYLPG